MREILHVGEVLPPSSDIAPSAPSLIDFKKVTKSYGKMFALNNASFDIKEGEFVTIVGQSGAGKSTVIKLLVVQEKPTSGTIYVAGRSLADLKNDDLPYYRRKIGVVFQDFKLLTQKTVYENIAYALEVSGISTKDIDRRVTKVLDLVNLSRRKNNYPAELSGGERQRVAIARALIHSPKILLADEPTGNLDPVNTWEIIELLYRINQRGTTIVLSTHNRQVVDRLGKRVILMKQGKVISDQKMGKYVI